jgi:thiol-disulfide isomerase/thioredoxin
MKKLLAGIAILAVILVADYIYSMYNVAPELNFGALSLSTLEGQPVQLASFKGKKVFVHFFGTWCGTCVKGLPSLEQAQTQLDKDNFLFVCISDESAETLKNFKAKTGFSIPILRSAKKLKELNILTLPTSYVLNPKGDMVYKKTGEKNWEDNDAMHELKMASE